MVVHSILMATDLSSNCDRPLDRVLALAQQLSAKLTVLHVLPARKGKQGADEALAYDRVRDAIPESRADVEVVIRTGDASDMIVRTARDIDASLIVTGTALMDSVRDFFLGTPVERIVRHTDIPVLVVKQRVETPYDKLLIVSDLSKCSRDALLGAAGMFPDAILHLVHPYHVPYQAWLKSEAVHREMREIAQRELDQYLADSILSDALRQRLRPFLGCGEAAEVVAKTLHDTGANLLVLGIGRRGIASGLTGVAYDALLASTPCDTLMLRAK